MGIGGGANIRLIHSKVKSRIRNRQGGRAPATVVIAGLKTSGGRTAENHNSITKEAA